MNRKERLYNSIVDAIKRGTKHARWGSVYLYRDEMRTRVAASGFILMSVRNGTIIMCPTREYPNDLYNEFSDTLRDHFINRMEVIKQTANDFYSRVRWDEDVAIKRRNRREMSYSPIFAEGGDA